MYEKQNIKLCMCALRLRYFDNVLAHRGQTECTFPQAERNYRQGGRRAARRFRCRNLVYIR